MEWMQYVITALIVEWVKFHKQWEFDLNGYSTSTSALCINSIVQMIDISIFLFVLLQVHVTSIWPQRFKFVGTFVCLFLLVLFVLVQVRVSPVRPRCFKFVTNSICQQLFLRARTFWGQGNVLVLSLERTQRRQIKDGSTHYARSETNKRLKWNLMTLAECSAWR